MRSKMDLTAEITFLKPEELKTPPGLKTGFSALDAFLLWKGIPEGAISLWSGFQGMGSTSLWIQTAKNLSLENKKSAWIDSPSSLLNPWALRRIGLGLRHIFWVSAPKDLKQKLWVLQELCGLGSFSLIGCSLEKDNLKAHHIVKLKKLAAKHHVGLVLLTERNFTHPLISLNMEFQKDHILISRAQHRPTPHTIPTIDRRDLYAHALPEFIQKRKPLGGRELLGLQSTGSIS